MVKHLCQLIPLFLFGILPQGALAEDLEKTSANRLKQSVIVPNHYDKKLPIPTVDVALPGANTSTTASSKPSSKKQAISSLTAIDYFVATTGSDSNPGTAEYPFRTIQKAANTVNAGDTIYIRGGTYREAVAVPVSASGTSGSLTNFFAYPGENPVISGAEVVAPWTELPHSSHPIYRHTNWPSDSQQVFVDGVPLRQIGPGGTLPVFRAA